MKISENDLVRLTNLQEDFIKYQDRTNSVYRVVNHHDYVSDDEFEKRQKAELTLRRKLISDFAALEPKVVKLIGGRPMMTIPAIPGSRWDVFDTALSGNFQSPAVGECLEMAIQAIIGAVSKARESASENESNDEIKHATSDLFEIVRISDATFRKLFRQKPASEKEVQDKYEDMLNSRDITFSREKETVEYSSKNYIPDFTFPLIGLAVEIKICDSARREKEMISEINDDILAYQTKYPQVLFVVYDCGFIRDVERFKSSFEKYENVIVQIVKH